MEWVSDKIGEYGYDLWSVGDRESLKGFIQGNSILFDFYFRRVFSPKSVIWVLQKYSKQSNVWETAVLHSN